MKEAAFMETWERMSPRQAEVMRLVAHGEDNAWIAGELGIAPATVELHRRYAMAKFQKDNGGDRLHVNKFIALWWQNVGLHENGNGKKRK